MITPAANAGGGRSATSGFVALLGMLIVMLTGCSGGARVAAENDRLRVEREDLRDRLAELEAERDELRTRVAELSESRGVDPAIAAAVPRVASLSLNVDRLERGEQDLIRVLVTPRDGRRRFVHAVGTMSIELLRIDQDGGSTTLDSCTLDPEQLRDAYRGGFGGTGYAVEFAQPSTNSENSASGSTTLVRVAFADAITSSTHTAESLVN